MCIVKTSSEEENAADCMQFTVALWRKFSSSTRRNEKRARFFIRAKRWKLWGRGSIFLFFIWRAPAGRAHSFSLCELIRLMDNVRNMIWSIYYAGCAYTEGRMKNCDGTNLISQTRRRPLMCAPGVKICVIIAMRDRALIYPHEPCLIFYPASPATQWFACMTILSGVWIILTRTQIVCISWIIILDTNCINQNNIGYEFHQ